MGHHCSSICLSLALISAISFAATDPFAQNVRTTEALTPEQEQKTFHLPPGFEIQLVASEPDIQKPINMAFDAKGRLWITDTREYPFPVKPGAPSRDKIHILEDISPETGKAGKITTFADNLNIPIGVYAWQDGAIGYSIPNIYRFSDVNAAGLAQKRDVLYGPFSYDKDTHGMTGSFRRGFDGWIYACHGFNNTTTVKGADGKSITMNSGNTYRMKLDGSHLEQFTFGQVNPFGLSFDTLGNLYSADCETFPIYQLLRGAYYPSFGKPDDGLGFGPAMMSHKHGSTAIGGIAYYADDRFPAEFQGNIFVGNVVTSKVNRDTLEDHGSTRLARQQPDFVRTDDPWFRSVDMQLGPDGALYIADFYNRIIGHYEVPLTHPGRDRERGRIWRIFYRGADGKPQLWPVRDWSSVSAAELIAGLSHANMTVRMQVANQLADRVGAAAVEPLGKLLGGNDATSNQKVHGMWVLFRLGALAPKLIETLAHDPDRAVRVHAIKSLCEAETLSPGLRQLAVAALQDADSFVRRAGAEALGLHPDLENIRPLLELMRSVPKDDTHLLHMVRMSIRNQVVPPANAARLPLDGWNEQDWRDTADVAVAVRSAEAGSFLLKYLRKYDNDPAIVSRDIKHAARYLNPEDTDSLAEFAAQKFTADVDFQLSLLKAIQDGAAQRGAPLSAGVLRWAQEIVIRYLSVKPAEREWGNSPVEGMAEKSDPWVVQKRASSDGNKNAVFFCSLPRGEQLTGILHSKTFEIPQSLHFFMAGHNGQPPTNFPVKNLIRLRAAPGGEVLAEAAPPRNDMAQPFNWDLKQHAGKKGYIEVVDADNGSAYAWLAVGRFEPAVVEVPKAVDQTATLQQSAMEIARVLKLKQCEPAIGAILSGQTDLETRAAAARALMSLNPENNTAALGVILDNANESFALREKMAAALIEANTAAARAVLIQSLLNAPGRLQSKLALALASTREGAEALLDAVAAGKASPAVLQDRVVRERLAASKPEKLDERLEHLTKGLAAADQEVQKIVDQHVAAFDPARASAEAGAKVFEKNCMLCHQIDGKGAHIGPQLDGIGARGLERLAEDVLDPSRNVDPAFRYSVITLKNGQTISGLQRREEGETVVFVDATAKEIPIQKSDIKARKESRFSLMPDNFAEVISPGDFNHLMAFLLSKRAKTQ